MTLSSRLAAAFSSPLLLLGGLALSASWSSAESLKVDWLYLANNGAWVARTETLTASETQVRLPVANLTPEQFWWQTQHDGTRLSWSSPDQRLLPAKGQPVEIESEPGLWLVQGVSGSHLVLQQGKTLRYWPQNQWHFLHFTAPVDNQFELKVIQAEKQKNKLVYAWQDFSISAQVRYRLDLAAAQPQLHQELIVSNLSEYDIEAPGYSFAQVQNAPQTMMRALSMEIDQKSMAQPRSGQSQGVPTLLSREPFTLSAGTHLWLPVSETALTDVTRQYQLQWDSRQQGLQKAQASILLESATALPDLAGPVKIGIFDGQVALLDSYFEPGLATQATLALGQSSLVSLTSLALREGAWRLSLANRSSDSVSIALTVSHWNGKQSQQIPMNVKVAANATEDIRLELGSGGMIRIVN
ncbi:hypothetical protein [Reinekea sp.]|jgi:hypothetical protein|uniref:hypothetical protein n=1 Tax=Reinekea sp. TaxID=1970455 RepID=UPI002A821E1C|nr:hypothetical protein [Reinekea sp.]